MHFDEFIGELELMDSNLWGHIIRLPPELANKYIECTTDKRVICTFNETVTIHCALMPSSNGFHFIMLNKKVRNKLDLLEGQTVTVKIEKDNSEYGLPMPDEFQEVLNQDISADKYFHALTKGKMRSLLYIAGNVKNSQKRIERALAIAFHLNKNKGEIDFKELQQDLKDFRNR